MSSTLLQGGLLVTMNKRREVIAGDIRLREGKIAAIGPSLKPLPDDKIIRTDNCFVIPGLIQAHVHLCQTLFRGMADDLELLDWLNDKIWPFEKAHTSESMRASAEIGLLEMQLSGTTSILDMGSVHHTDALFAAAEFSGMRYWGGNCLMDMKATSGPLYKDTAATLKECERLIKKWHKKTELLHYAISPRFVISCTEKILKESLKLQKQYSILLHTHASENKGEVALIKKRTKLNNVEYLKKLGLLNEHSVIAHGIHLTNSEVTGMIQCQAGLVHCPSSNLKLASGLADIEKYDRKGMKVALGSDGAPCNNMMDAFMEMRLAALLQKPKHGPTALPAPKAFELATLGGARVLGMEGKIGSLEVGKRADVVVVRRDHPSVTTVTDAYSALVYSCSGRDVRDVWIEGKNIVREGRHQIFNQEAVLKTAQLELAKLTIRLGEAHK